LSTFMRIFGGGHNRGAQLAAEPAEIIRVD
jgi:hypothetical protein